VLAGLTAVATGAVAALVRKGGPQHIRADRSYYEAIIVLFVPGPPGAPARRVLTRQNSCDGGLGGADDRRMHALSAVLNPSPLSPDGPGLSWS
jgi:hypothetical protein